MRLPYLPLLLLPLLLTSCIEEYVIPDPLVADAERPLYIEGHIISGGNSTFFVTQATPMYSRQEGVDDAHVVVESDGGFRSDAATCEGMGQYVVPTGTLNDTEQYRVVVTVGGETYASQWQRIMPPAPIDEVNFRENEYNRTVDIRVSSTAPDDAPRHYLFTYEENWEIESAKDFNYVGFLDHHKNERSIYFDASFYPLLTFESNPYRYCWKRRYSSNIILYSTQELESNAIRNFVVRSIPANTEEISVLYAIDVHQSVISDEAYDYYRNMERLTEQTGGLFSPTPYRYRGNVSCTTHPDAEVYGYVTASSSTMRRYILDPADLQRTSHYYSVGRTYYRPLSSGGPEWRTFCLYMVGQGGVLSVPIPEKIDPDTYYYDRECFDCLSRGGTKDKPSWWPNDHE